MFITLGRLSKPLTTLDVLGNFKHLGITSTPLWWSFFLNPNILNWRAYLCHYLMWSLCTFFPICHCIQKLVQCLVADMLLDRSNSEPYILFMVVSRLKNNYIRFCLSEMWLWTQNHVLHVFWITNGSCCLILYDVRYILNMKLLWMLM